MKRLLISARLALIVSALGIASFVQQAQAGLLSNTGLARVFGDAQLEPESLDLMAAAAQDLYTSPSKSVGDQNSWTNSETGTTGTVQITEIRDGCVKLFHSVNVAKPKKLTEVAVWRCKTADGSWQLSTLD